MRILQLNAVTKQDRNHVTAFVMECVSAAGGWVEDVRMYSNIMTTVLFQIPANRVASFLADLHSRGLHVEGAPADMANAEDSAEQRGSLQISFIHNEPDLKREVPQVPG
jgi:hypothetical protein